MLELQPEEGANLSGIDPERVEWLHSSIPAATCGTTFPAGGWRPDAPRRRDQGSDAGLKGRLPFMYLG